MKRSTWFFLILFLIAIGIYYLVNFLPPKTIAESTPTADQISYPLRDADASMTSIQINSIGVYLNMERNSEAIWEIIDPEPGLADQTKLSEAETQLASLKIAKNLGIVSSLDDFGLSKPKSWISVTYSNGLVRKLFIGSLTPTNSGYYVQVDNLEVVIISQFSLDAILDLPNNPPYPPTPTPSATSEQSIITSTEETTLTPSFTDNPTP